MSEYKLSKSTMERYDIRIKGENNWKCAWATISISDDGMFNVQSDCGDFSYSWGSFGDCFKTFLISICSKDTSYLYDKIHNQERANNVDVEKTVNNMKKKIIQNRLENYNRTPYLDDELSPEEARWLWDELDTMQRCHDEVSQDAFVSLFYGLSSTERNKVFSDEFWYDDFIVTTNDRHAETFCNVVAPLFAEILKEELKVSV
ncbi:hypothetical protein ACDN41_12220 [Priestia aryabhattai]|uniref:hypothetical protein n=1 Tax=Priestia aryabhattai TaxID=412384 RepID=UPI00353198F1